ncbi:MAG: cysteine-rich CWC family protein [Flavobacteriales bacterium]|nr:cysteine-rich CWC family protein [Flavobacteriales bacterium]
MDILMLLQLSLSNIENNTKITQKICSKCKEPFGCQNLERGCWCENHQLTAEQLTYLKENYDNCLCEKCILALKIK